MDVVRAGSNPAGNIIVSILETWSKYQTNLSDTVAEWSNARDLSPLLFGGAGSNPAGVIKICYYFLFASLAQLVEHRTFNPRATGSSPVWGLCLSNASKLLNWKSYSNHFYRKIYSPKYRFPQPTFNYDQLLFSSLSWRNWSARSTVNREVGGSSPPESVRLRSVMVITVVFESTNPSSILGATC